MKRRTISGLVSLLLFAISAVGQSAAVHQQIQQTYNFQPHLLSNPEITAKSAGLDQFWTKAKAQSEPSTAKHETAAASAKIEGAGSTTIKPLFRAWIDEYTRLHSRFQMSYTPIGSRGGFRMLAGGTAFFAVTDLPIPDDQLTQGNGRVLHLPIAMNAVVPVYNIPQVSQLRFSGDTLAGIFLGKITKWDDPAIANDNPGVKLPAMEIKVRHEFPSGSVETQVIADYLSKVSPTFKTAVASPPTAGWPLASYRYKGAEGTAGFVSQTPGSFGYLPLAFAHAQSREGSLKYAAVKNSDGEFVMPSPESVTAATASAKIKPPDFRISITNAPGKTSYPIASFMWLLLYENPKEKKQNEAMVGFLNWALMDGQKVALKLGYPTLPSDLVQVELQQLRTSAR